MKTCFLLILITALSLTGCSPAGSQTRTTVIVVTATPLPATPINTLFTATQPAAQPTNTSIPENMNTAVPVPTNTLAATMPTSLPNVIVPATGPALQVSIKQLLDFNVVDSSGNLAGKVKDLIISRGAANSAIGEIPYLAFESNLREDWLIPVPWKYLQVRPDLQVIVLPATAAQLLNAPGFNKDFWPASIAAQQTTLQNFWTNPGSTAAPSAPLSQPGGVLQASDYIRGDDVLSLDFLSPQGVKLGEVKDLAVDWQNSQPGSAQVGRFGYVLLELDDNISVNETVAPIPWRLVNPAPGQKNVIVNLTPLILQTAPNFAKGLLPNLYSEPLNSQLNTYWSGK